MSVRRQLLAVALLAAVSLLASAAAFTLLVRFQQVPPPRLQPIEAGNGPVARVTVAPEHDPANPPPTTGAAPPRPAPAPGQPPPAPDAAPAPRRGDRPCRQRAAAPG